MKKSRIKKKVTLGKVASDLPEDSNEVVEEAVKGMFEKASHSSLFDGIPTIQKLMLQTQKCPVCQQKCKKTFIYNKGIDQEEFTYCGFDFCKERIISDILKDDNEKKYPRTPEGRKNATD